jgi:HEPN domain-containing protein
MGKLTRRELQKLTRLRLEDAQMLLLGGRFAAAYYLTGLAVECALKACIARSTAEFDFPDMDRVRDSWHHDLTGLLRTAGLFDQHAKKAMAMRSFEANWETVKDWKVSSRYEQRSDQEAHNIYNAASEANHGIVPWIEVHW